MEIVLDHMIKHQNMPFDVHTMAYLMSTSGYSNSSISFSFEKLHKLKFVTWEKRGIYSVKLENITRILSDDSELAKKLKLWSLEKYCQT